MMNEQTPASFAIVRMDDSDLDVPAVARLTAELLDLSLVDLIQVLPQRSGILAENLAEHVADRCVAVLAAAGIDVRAVPQSAVVEPPEVVTLRSGRADEEVFFYVTSDRKGAVKWPDVIWVDFVSVQEPSVEEVEDWVISQDPEGGEGGGSRRRFVTKRTLFADLATREPWLLLRIPLERFAYAATGLPVFPDRRENLIAFAATIASHASAARLGVGMQWLGSQSPPRENRMPSQTIYHGYLRWQLTRLFLN
ncbi:MAG TPA: hypothetical protein VGP63_22280 [Planctomycetaceae bacterium]|nr:hypothetical protein [Planctomycetaceae bacterium]